MKKIILSLCFILNINAYDFGLKINEFNSSEVEAFFNYEYAKAKPYNCNLRSLFLPNNQKGRIFKKMFKEENAYKNLRSIACVIKNENYFLWLMFQNNTLKQIKYEINKDYNILKQEIAKKYTLIKESSISLQDYYMDNYDEFDIDENTNCLTNYCKKFSIFKYENNIELVLIDTYFNKIKKSSIIIRDKNLQRLYKKNN